MKIPSLLLCLLPALAATASAQSPENLIGLTRFAPALRQVDHTNCAPLGQCVVPLPAVAVAPPFAGGTGWDPVRPGAWVSDGRLLAKFDENCAPMCPPIVPPTLSPNAWITGIEVSERLDQVVFVDSLGFLHFYSNTCPPQPVNVCQTGLMPTAVGDVTSGLAIDEARGLVFIAYSMFPAGLNRIAVSRLNNPCQILCLLQVGACPGIPFGALTGLACDWGKFILYGTDGSSTVAWTYALPSTTGCPVFTGQQCCPLPAVADPMVGLAIRPGGATRHGQPCANGTCPPCPMRHTLVNDPVLGNAQFRLALDQAPVGELAWCLIGAGPCSNPGLLVAPLCGPVYVGPFLGSIGPNVTGGVGACNGSTTFAFALPPIGVFAGLVLSSQCAVLCSSAAGIGTSLSNCLSWELQGS